MKSEEAGLLVLLGLFAVPFLFAYGVLANGFVLMKLWNWYMVGLWGMEAITISMAIGLSLIVAYLTKHHEHGVKDEYKESSAVYLIGGLLHPWLALLVAWIISFFVL